LRSSTEILQQYFDKIAAIAATNAIATYTGATKPSAPRKPKGPSSSQQPLPGATSNVQGTQLNAGINDSLTQNSLNSGGNKLETGSSLPVTT
jgi:hypothetical protein